MQLERTCARSRRRHSESWYAGTFSLVGGLHGPDTINVLRPTSRTKTRGDARGEAEGEERGRAGEIERRINLSGLEGRERDERQSIVRDAGAKHYGYMGRGIHALARYIGGQNAALVAGDNYPRDDNIIWIRRTMSHLTINIIEILAAGSRA